MNKNLGRPMAAALLCGASLAAHAATLTLTQWTFGSGNGVHASSPAYSGQAGGFSGTLGGAGAAFDGSIDSYCVELTQTFHWNTAHANYHVVSSSVYFGVDKAGTLARLLSYANPLVAGAAPGSRDDFSTSLQLAIWNTVYDDDDTLSVGAFADTSGFAAKANDFLAGAKNQASQLDLWVLQSITGNPLGSTGHQDQLIWRTRPLTTQEVPEPASMALVLAACGGLGLTSRRRPSRKG